MRYLLLLPLALLCLPACKEKSPAIDFGPKASDTAYVATVETPQQRVVMIEEFTGVKCPQCPAGHKILKGIKDINGSRVAIIGVQSFGNAQTNPVKEDDAQTKHDNRTQIGTNMQNGVFGPTGGVGLPCAGIDRVSLSGAMLFSRSAWSSIVSDRLQVPAKANITMTSAYDAGMKRAIIKVRVAYTAAVSVGQVLNLALIENDIEDVQEDGLTIIEDYKHEHVLRDILTSPTGSAILTGTAIVAGQVYERIFVYDVAAAWNPDNCRLVAYVTNDNGADKEVQQAAEIHLK